jgi:conjugal transfer pilus assembly protein TrbC
VLRVVYTITSDPLNSMTMQRIAIMANKMSSMGNFISRIFIFLFIWCVCGFSLCTAYGQEFTVETLNEITKEVKKLKQQLKLPEELNKEGSEAAQRCVEKFHSEENQKIIQQEKERLSNEVFHQARIIDDKDGKIHGAKGLSGSERLYIFVSSSVPESTLKSYVKDVDKTKDPNIAIVFRGFVGGMEDMESAVEYLKWLIVKDPKCLTEKEQNCDGFHAGIQIDPLLFERFGIESVPAFVFLQNVKVDDSEFSLALKDNLKTDPKGLIVRGDITLRHALERFDKESGNQRIKDVLKMIGGEGFYGKQ